jgi:O-antigen/teichoic acid export membrane protein
MDKIKAFLFKNTSTRQTLAKNSFWLLIGDVFGRLLKLAIVVVATRELGVEGWGIFSYGLAFVGLFFLLGDFGINTFITKEMSKDTENKHKYLATAIIIRLSFLLVFFLAAILAGPHLGKIELGFSMILVLATFSIFESIREFAMSINRSQQRMEVEGFSKILINLSITVIGIILLSQSAEPFSIAMAYMIGSILATIYILWAIRGELKNIKWKFSRENFKIIYNFSWPIVIMSFFGLLFSLDTIMLGQMKSATEVGLYTTGQRIISLSSMIPGLLAASLLPIFSKYEQNSKRAGAIFEKIMTALLAFGIPIVVGGIFFSRDIIALMFGPEFLAGTLVLQILMISILASFPNIILTNLIFSKNLQKTFIFVTTFGVLLDIGLNFWLIPIYGAVGAAASTVLAELIIVGANWRKMKKFVPFSVIPKLGKVVLATVIMTLGILLLNAIGIHFVIVIILAIIIYVLALHLLKEPIFKEILSLRKAE